MELHKESLLYKIAYFFCEKKKRPTNANTCRFFWRTVFMSVVVPVSMIFVYTIIGAGFIVGFFFAKRPTILENDSDVELMVYYKNWPTIYGHRIMPIILVYIASAGLLLFIYSSEIVNGLVVLSNVVMVSFSESVFLWTVGAVVTLIFFIYGVRKFRGTDVHKLLKEYIRAKKEQFCPVIHFVE